MHQVIITKHYATKDETFVGAFKTQIEVNGATVASGYLRDGFVEGFLLAMKKTVNYSSLIEKSVNDL